MIGLIQKGNIWIVGCEEEFAFKNEEKARKTLNTLAEIKAKNGQLYQLEQEEVEKTAENEHIAVLNHKIKKLEADIDYYKKLAKVE